MTYADKLKDPRWIARREEIIRKAGDKCEDCGGRKRLEVHHLAYISGREPWEYSDDLLMALCPACHVERQNHEDAIRVSMGEVFKRTKPAELKQKAWFVMEYAAMDLRIVEGVKMFGGDQ